MSDPDKYSSFALLAEAETEGTDYRIRVETRPSPVIIIAPHGGAIELGTSEIAAAIARDAYSLYCFEGLQPDRRHCDLHITSERFDEPTGVRMVLGSEIAVAIHGRRDRDDAESVWLGGRDAKLRDAIAAALLCAGFKSRTTGHSLPGASQSNICNRGTKAGAQLEIPRGLRDQLVNDTAALDSFSTAVRGAIELRREELAHARPSLICTESRPPSEGGIPKRDWAPISYTSNRHLITHQPVPSPPRREPAQLRDGETRTGDSLPANLSATCG